MSRRFDDLVHTDACLMANTRHAVQAYPKRVELECIESCSKLRAERTEALAAEQALPTPNDAANAQDFVIASIEQRKRVGLARYGTLLQPHNGRDSLRDLFEELQDATIYCAQRIMERDSLRAQLQQLRDDTALLRLLRDPGIDALCVRLDDTAAIFERYLQLK